MPRPEINVGVLVAHSPEADQRALRAFARRMADDVRPLLEAASGADWHFHHEDPTRLAADDARRPSDFLDEASLRMVEGPFDVIVVVTDVAIVSRRRRVEPGLASPVSRIATISARPFRLSPRGEPVRALDAPAVRVNAATLLLHLLGHLMGLDHERRSGGVMQPFVLDPARTEVPAFTEAERARLARRASRFPEEEHATRTALHAVGYHVVVALRNLGLVLRVLARNDAPFLALALPSLATAAVAPTFILVFTAEIWDVGLNMPTGVTYGFAIASILAATWYLSVVQSLFFPRKDRRVITEHLAVLNATIFLAMLLGIVGLYAMVTLLMLAVETWIFPAGLISTWPTLDIDRDVDVLDKVQIASFISTVGVLTGALAGGLESRTVIRHLALFLEEP